MHFLNGSKRWFLLSVLFSCLVSFLDLTGPKVINYTVDSIIGNEDPAVAGFVGFLMRRLGGPVFLREHLWVLAAAVAGLALAAGVCRYSSQLTNTAGAEKLVKRMRDQLFRQIEHLTYSWFGENHTGDIIQRCTSDVETIKTFVSEQLTSLVRIVVLMGLALFFMAGISRPLTGVSAIFFPIIVGYSLFFHNRIGNAFQHADEEEGKLSAIAQENLTGVRVVRAFGRERFESERFEKQNKGYTRMWIRLMGLLSAFWCSSDLISGLQVMSVTVLGAVFCVRGQLTAGQYIAFIYYNSMLTWPVRQLGRVIADLSKAGISIDRLRYIMNAEREQEVILAERNVPNALHQKPDNDNQKDWNSRKEKIGSKNFNISNYLPSDDIEFDHVSFQYGNGSGEVLRDVSFVIPAGSTVGILGSTGSGKSTLTALLDRLYELPADGSQGAIRIGGVNIARIPLGELRRKVGIVLQEPYLFSMSLGDNIAIAAEGEESVSENSDMEKDDPGGDTFLPRIREAAGIACLDETAESFPKGYDTFVGERGVTLSGGQKQRTAIAQMLMRHPEIMVFDDSLSAVDAETDARIRRSLKEKVHGSTVILISHRITTLRNADRILVMDQGKVVQSGTHEELVSSDGLYRRIYELQVQQSENAI